MPEISEVARVVHFVRTHLKNRKIAKISVQDDPIVYGKVGTSAAEFQKALTGRTILDAKQQGKYFWFVMDKPPHPLMHFSMTGWLKLSNVETGYYKPKQDKSKIKQEKTKTNEDGPEAVYNNAGSTREGQQEWPPKFYKFVLQMDGEPKVQAAFVDARRLGRIRLIDVAADKMRDTTPLKENGPDPVVDKDQVTLEWFVKKVRSKKSPIKAVLLDQSNISGVGNWVADEVLHHASIHPEQYSNSLSDVQIKQLHESLLFVCTTACDVLGDSDKYPEDWIFRHRWNKGKKGVNVMPNGEKIVHLTVGGRTSAIVPSRQKKSGPVAGDIDRDLAVKADADDGDEKLSASKGASSRSASGKKRAAGGSSNEVKPGKKARAHSTPKSTRKAEPETGTNSSAKRRSTRSSR